MRNFLLPTAYIKMFFTFSGQGNVLQESKHVDIDSGEHRRGLVFRFRHLLDRIRMQVRGSHKRYLRAIALAMQDTYSVISNQ